MASVCSAVHSRNAGSKSVVTLLFLLVAVSTFLLAFVGPVDARGPDLTGHEWYNKTKSKGQTFSLSHTDDQTTSQSATTSTSVSGTATGGSLTVTTSGSTSLSDEASATGSETVSISSSPTFSHGSESQSPTWSPTGSQSGSLTDEQSQTGSLSITGTASSSYSDSLSVSASDTVTVTDPSLTASGSADSLTRSEPTASESETNEHTASMSRSAEETGSMSLTVTHGTGSISETDQATATQSPSETETRNTLTTSVSESASSSLTVSMSTTHDSATGDHSQSATRNTDSGTSSMSPTPSNSATETLSATRTSSVSQTETLTDEETGTVDTGSASASLSESETNERSASDTFGSPTRSASDDVTSSESLTTSRSVSTTGTDDNTQTESPTASTSESVTTTFGSHTQTASETTSGSQTVTFGSATRSETDEVTGTKSATTSETPTASSSSTASQSDDSTLSKSAGSTTVTGTVTGTHTYGTLTMSSSATMSDGSATKTEEETATASTTQTTTASATASATSTVSTTLSSSETTTASHTESVTATMTGGTATVSSTASHTASVTVSTTASTTASESETDEATMTESRHSPSGSVSRASPSESHSGPTRTATQTSSETASSSNSATTSKSETSSNEETASSSLTMSVSGTASVTSDETATESRQTLTSSLSTTRSSSVSEGSPSPTESSSGSQTETVTGSGSSSATVSTSLSQSQTVSGSVSRTDEMTATKSGGTATQSPTTSTSETASLSASQTASTSVSATSTGSSTITDDATGSASLSVGTASGTPSGTQTVGTKSETPSSSMTQDATTTPGPTKSRQLTRSHSETETDDQTSSGTGTVSASATQTQSASSTVTVSPMSHTGSQSMTQSVTESGGTASLTTSQTATGGSQTATVTMSLSHGTLSSTASASTSASATISRSDEHSASAFTATGTLSGSDSMTASDSASDEPSASRSPGTATKSQSTTESPTIGTRTSTMSMSDARTASSSVSTSATMSMSASSSVSASATTTGSLTDEMTGSRSQTPTNTLAPTPSPSFSEDRSTTNTGSLTESDTDEGTVSASVSGSASLLASETATRSRNSHSASPSTTKSFSDERTLTSSAGSASHTASVTPSPSNPSPSTTGTVSATLSISASTTTSQSQTDEQSATDSPSTSVSHGSVSGTDEMSASRSGPTPSQLVSSSPTGSVSTSLSFSRSVGPSRTRSVSTTPTITITPPPTPSWTFTPTPSDEITSSESPSVSSSRTVTATQSMSESETFTGGTLTGSASPSESETNEETSSGSVTDSLSATATGSVSVSSDDSATKSLTLRLTHSQSISLSASASQSATPTHSGSLTDEDTSTPSPSISISITPWSVTATGDQSPTKTASASDPRTMTESPTITPPPTPTPSASETNDMSASSSTTETLSKSDDVTASETQTRLSMTQTLSPSADVTATRSMSKVIPPTPTATHSPSPTAALTSSFTLSLSDERTMTQTPRETLTFPVTESRNSMSESNEHSSTYTSSNRRGAAVTQTLSGSLTGDRTATRSDPISLTMKLSLSMLTMSLTASAEYTGTKSPSQTVSMDSMSEETAAYTILPRNDESTYIINTRIDVVFSHTPLHMGPNFYSRAGILWGDLDCGVGKDNVTAHPLMLPMTFQGRPRRGVLQNNWTATLPHVGEFTFCFYHDQERKWFRILNNALTRKRQNVTVTPRVYLDDGVPRLQTVGESMDYFLRIDGANLSYDKVRFIHWGKQCNSPVRFWNLISFNVTEALGLRYLIVKREPGAVDRSGDFTLCYQGFPARVNTRWIQYTTRPIRFKGRATHIKTFTSGFPLRALRRATVMVAGAGLATWDRFIVANYDCSYLPRLPLVTDIVVPAPILRLIGQGPNKPADVEGLYELPVTFFPTFAGTMHLCYRSNTSRMQQWVMELDVAPIRASSYAPNSSLFPEPTHAWPATSDVILSFTGDGIDNRYDFAWLYNSSTGCSGENPLPMRAYSDASTRGLVALGIVAEPPVPIPVPGQAGPGPTPVPTSAIASGELRERIWRVRVPRAGTFAVCYNSNLSVPEFLGVVTIKPRWYSRETAALDDVFTKGVNLFDTFVVSASGIGLMPLTDLVYVTKKNPVAGEPSCVPHVPVPQPFQPLPIVWLPLRRFENGTIVFNATSRGQYVVCYVTFSLAPMESEAFAVFPDPPKSFSPAMIPMGRPTRVRLSGSRDLDLQDGDEFTFCGVPLPEIATTEVVAVSNNTISMTASPVGVYHVCFTSGVASPANQQRQRTILTQRLSVAPVVTSTVVVPPSTIVGSRVVVNVFGNGLLTDDVLYTCRTDPNRGANASNGGAVYVRLNATSWEVSFASAGTFELCYLYAARTAFPPGPLSAVVNVDPTIFYVFPTQITASTEVLLNMTGVDVAAIPRVFLRPGVGTCNETRNPFDVELVRKSPTGFLANVPRRGLHSVCYVGPSSRVYGVAQTLTNPNLILSVPRIDSYVVRQDGVGPTGSPIGQLLWANHPVDVTIVGGGIEVPTDRFYAISGTTCNTTERTNLGTPNPPLTAVDRVLLTFSAPAPGTYSICYILGGVGSSDSFFMIPSLVMTFQSSLLYFNNTLAVRGPLASAASNRFLFAFSAKAVPSAGFTSFQKSTGSASIAVPWVPTNGVRIRVTVLSPSGVTVSVLNLDVVLSSTSSVCQRFPQALADSDSLRHFAMSIIALHNFGVARCAELLPRDTQEGSRSLFLATLNAIKADESLMADATFVTAVLSSVLIEQRQLSSVLAGDGEKLLDAMENTLNRGPSSLSKDLLSSHIATVGAIAGMLRGAAAGEIDAAVMQRIGMKAVARVSLVGRRFCESDVSSVQDEMRSGDDESLMVTMQKRAVTEQQLIEAGRGVQAIVGFRSATTQPVCMLMTPMRFNIVPQRLSSSLSRRQLQTEQQPNTGASTAVEASSVGIGAAVPLPAFNFPVMMFALPSEAAGTNQLVGVREIAFKVPYVPPTLAPGGEARIVGVTLDAQFYRFVPDVGGSSVGGGQSGQWVIDRFTTATLDSDSSTLRVRHDLAASIGGSTAAQPQSQYLMLSGTFAVRPVIVSPPLRSEDRGIVYLLAGLVAAHLMMSALGKIADHRRDAAHVADAESLAQWQTNISLHRYASIGTRKPHHPVPTWARVTSLFTFAFAAALFSLLVAEYAPWGHAAYWNVPYGLAVAVLATPFSGIVRLALHYHLRDYATAVGGASAVVATAIAVPVAGPFAASIAAGVAGVVFFLGAVSYFRSRWSLEPRPWPGPFPAVFGAAFHVAVELTACGYCGYQALYVGTPRDMQNGFHFFQILVWALGIDCVALEPVKNRVIVFLRDFTSRHDERVAVEAASRVDVDAAAIYGPGGSASRRSSFARSLSNVSGGSFTSAMGPSAYGGGGGGGGGGLAKLKALPEGFSDDDDEKDVDEILEEVDDDDSDPRDIESISFGDGVSTRGGAYRGHRNGGRRPLRRGGLDSRDSSIVEIESAVGSAFAATDGTEAARGVDVGALDEIDDNDDGTDAFGTVAPRSSRGGSVVLGLGEVSTGLVRRQRSAASTLIEVDDGYDDASTAAPSTAGAGSSEAYWESGGLPVRAAPRRAASRAGSAASAYRGDGPLYDGGADDEPDYEASTTAGNTDMYGAFGFAPAPSRRTGAYGAAPVGDGASTVGGGGGSFVGRQRRARYSVDSSDGDY